MLSFLRNQECRILGVNCEPVSAKDDVFLPERVLSLRIDYSSLPELSNSESPPAKPGVYLKEIILIGLTHYITSINGSAEESVRELIFDRVYLQNRVAEDCLKTVRSYTQLHSKDNAAARRRLRRRITYTSRKLTTQPTKLAKECDLVLHGRRSG
jgi:hypothetical protein